MDYSWELGSIKKIVTILFEIKSESIHLILQEKKICGYSVLKKKESVYSIRNNRLTDFDF